jgi:hypothetical protein
MGESYYLIPPNPTFYDTKPIGFTILPIPSVGQNTSVSWGVWSCWWKANWVWESNWQWESDWEWESDLMYDEETGTMTDNGGWVNNGSWADHGMLVDHGDWQYDWTGYQAALSASIVVKPDSSVPTASGKNMKSGYGINLAVSTNLYSDAPASDITGAQNIISYYPEFNYNNYCSASDMVSGGCNAGFELKPNSYSIYKSRVHFIPLWFPDGRYVPQARVIDVWTPAGMLSCMLEDYVNISGSVYDDYHIGPK